MDEIFSQKKESFVAYQTAEMYPDGLESSISQKVNSKSIKRIAGFALQQKGK